VATPARDRTDSLQVATSVSNATRATSGEFTVAEEKNKKQKDATIHIDLGLGGLFNGISNLIDLVSELAEPGETVTSSSGKINFGQASDLQGVYGFTVRTGIGGIPRVESFGNIRETDEGPVIAETREPMIDIFDEEESILVVAELPGVAEHELSLTVQNDVLALTTNGKWKYAKEILLPAPVLEEGMTISYNNGVLEVRLPKVK
jgi:HSP20 family protein